MTAVMDAAEPPAIITLTTVLSLAAVLTILGTAYTAAAVYLPRNASTKIRILFVWHAFDITVHTLLEGSYLYNTFFTSTPLALLSTFPPSTHAAMTPPDVYFLGNNASQYGAFYGTSPTALMWQEYARADKRWGGSDLCIASMEILTVGVMGPLAGYVCWLLAQERWKRAWFVACCVAVGELYGGWMTFCPEWLSGSTNLATNHWLFLWIYLFFFNTLWVWIPIWVLYEGYKALVSEDEKVTTADKKRK